MYTIISFSFFIQSKVNESFITLLAGTTVPRQREPANNKLQSAPPETTTKFSQQLPYMYDIKKRFSIRYVEPGMSISSCSTVWEFLSSDPCTVQLLATCRSAVPSCTSLCRPSSALCRLIQLSGFPTFSRAFFIPALEVRRHAFKTQYYKQLKVFRCM